MQWNAARLRPGSTLTSIIMVPALPGILMVTSVMISDLLSGSVSVYSPSVGLPLALVLWDILLWTAKQENLLYVPSSSGPERTVFDDTLPCFSLSPPGQPLSPIHLVWSLPDRHLWNAKMKLIVRSSSQKRPIPALLPYSLWLFLQECPSGCMLHHLLPQVWGPTASPQGSGLPRRSLPSAAWRPSKRLPCLLLSSSSPDTSPLGPMAWLQLDGPFRTTKGNWMRYISARIEDSNLMFGMHWGMLRQCPLVMAYRGRTDRDWIIEVTMCCPESTK